jgi:hypothetical protein
MMRVTQPLRAGLRYATPSALVRGHVQASELVMGEFEASRSNTPALFDWV